MQAPLRLAVRSRWICAGRVVARRQTTKLPASLSRPFSGGTSARLQPSHARPFDFKEYRSHPPEDADWLTLKDPSDAKSKPIGVGWTPRRGTPALWLRGSGKSHTFQRTAVSLRDSCQCSKCRDPSSGQKSFSTIELDPNTLITEVSETKDGLLVKFDRGIARLGETDHEMLIDWKLLKELSNDRERAFDSLYTIPQVQARAGVHYWDAHSLPSRVRHYDFEDFKAQKEEFWEAMSDMVRLGIVFIKNVPKDPNSVVEIANAMGPIKETFYGRTFDVQAKPNADNVAYTSEYLGLHQDLLYLHETPQVQLLHCMENSCAGGESLFADAERVLKLLKTHVRQGGPLSTLKSEEIKYGYHKHGQNYTRRKPVFQEHPLDEGEFTNMYWSPPFQDIDEWSGVRLEEWIPAARIVEDLINHKEAVYTHRLQPGECVIFDNLRVLHGRRAFDAAGGSRWLRGTYLAPDAYLSKITQIPKDIEAKSRAAADIAVGDRPKGAVTWPSYRDKLLKKMLSEYPHIFTPASDKASSKVADHPVKLEYPRILSAARNETALEEAESYAKQQVERLKSGGPRVSSSASGEAAPRDGTDKDKNEEIERLREELRKFRVDVDKFSKGKGKDSSW